MGSTILVGILDSTILLGCVFLAVFLSRTFGIGHVSIGTGAFFWHAVWFTLGSLLGISSVGLYRRRQRPRLHEVVARVAVAMIIGGAITATILLLLTNRPLAGDLLGLTMLLGTVSLAVSRWSMLKGFDSNPIKRRVLVLGSGWAASKVGMLRRRSDRRRFDVVGYVAASPGEWELAAEFELAPVFSIEDFDNIPDVDQIVVAVDDRRGAFPVKQLMQHKSLGIRVTDIVSFLEDETEQIDLDVMRPDWLVFTKGGHTYAPMLHLSKRVVDIIVGSVMMVLTAPLLIAIAVAIRIEEGFRAPAFYRQERVGRHGRVFQLLKFRSMVVDAESGSGPKWSSARDNRVTRVGRFIRRFRLDELPQLINVLRGEMSIVGPRPERPEFVRELSQVIPWYDFRHSVRPGLAGWAQLNFPYGASVEDASVKHKYDLYYIKNATLIFDLMVLLQTVEVVLWGRTITMSGRTDRAWHPRFDWHNEEPGLVEVDTVEPDIRRDVA